MGFAQDSPEKLSGRISPKTSRSNPEGSIFCKKRSNCKNGATFMKNPKGILKEKIRRIFQVKFPENFRYISRRNTQKTLLGAFRRYPIDFFLKISRKEIRKNFPEYCRKRNFLKNNKNLFQLKFVDFF